MLLLEQQPLQDTLRILLTRTMLRSTTGRPSPPGD
jgi:hypothetical protein